MRRVVSIGLALILAVPGLAVPFGVSAADLDPAYGGGQFAAPTRTAARTGGVVNIDGNYRGYGGLPAATGPLSRIKDIATLQSVRDNQLVGYGLVIGLQGSGDSLRNSPFTEQSIRPCCRTSASPPRAVQARSKNVAAVIVTANLPPFVESGSRIDVSVSSLGDASSLQGGTLVMTPLRAADGDIYAVAQGSVSVTGFSAQGQAETLTQGVPRHPDACPTAPSLNARSCGAARRRGAPRAPASEWRISPPRSASPTSSTTIPRRASASAWRSRRTRGPSRSPRPQGITAARFYAELENLVVEADQPARVVHRRADRYRGDRPGCRVSRVAISHGTLTIRITEQPKIVQPEPFSDGETAVEPSTVIDAQQPGDQLAIVNGPNLQTLVGGLNRLGVKPAGIIAILQGIKSAGALQAELVIQ